jgi:hypothetical protein
MFCRFARGFAGAVAIIFSLVCSAQAVPVTLTPPDDYFLTSDGQNKSNPDEVLSHASADDVVAVPLPSAVVLFVSALAGLGLLACRRRTTGQGPL